MKKTSRRRLAKGSTAFAFALALSAPTAAYAQATYSFDLPAQELGRSLRAVARRTGENIVFDPGAVRGKRAPALNGSFPAAQAIERLLAGSGLGARRTSGGSWVVSASGEAGAADEAAGEGALAAGENNDILVVGSRVRGAPPAAPVVSIDQAEMRRAGHNDLGEVARAIPQNFGGGQNPGVVPGALAGNVSNQNSNSASSINLRGLGPDATLTLLNGRRLAYDGVYQAVDLSVIPITAVDRIEVVADGASAIYGSDAVAGVANIILRRDYRGVATGARVGTATGGGDTQQQYDVVGGTTWNSGGFILSYRYSENTALYARQRGFTDYLRDPTSLFPASRQHSVLASGHQAIGEYVELGMDALYNWRRTRIFTTTATSLFTDTPESESYTISPSLRAELGGGWSATLGGVLARSKVHYLSESFTSAGAPQSRSEGCYCNDMRTAEVGAEGPVLTLPGGDARLAIGGGYRWTRFSQTSLTSAIRAGGSRDSYYGYGELYLPLLGSVPLVHRLSVTGALRYEDYGDSGNVVTPKVGLFYAPTPDFDLRASWGQSYKAPTLLQQYQEYFAILYPASIVGGSGLPPTASILLLTGGNLDLRPERASSWSATLGIHPRTVSGLTFELSYFHTRYHQRVLNPVTNILTALNNPVYEEFLIRNPSAAAQAAAIAPAPQGLLNFVGIPYNPADVVAIVRNINTNAARQTIEGVDLLAAYRFETGGNSFAITAGATWLTSSQRNSSASPAFDLAGTIYNPARFRARGGFSWSKGGLTGSAYLNRTGGVTDTRFLPEDEIGGMTTLDLSLVYSAGADAGLLSGTELVFSVQNATNAAPSATRRISDDLATYDSTNYSAIGRFVSFSILKHW